jgi:formylmethanofuran dehydrogenase subunit E
LLINIKKEREPEETKKKEGKPQGRMRKSPSTPSKFFQVREVRVTLYPSNLLYEVLGCMRRKPQIK